jgi:hypothetical protein
MWKTEEECLPVVKHSQVEELWAYNIIDKCFGGENVQMLTPLLEQINQGESTTIEQRDLTAKNWKNKLL